MANKEQYIGHNIILGAWDSNIPWPRDSQGTRYRQWSWGIWGHVFPWVKQYLPWSCSHRLPGPDWTCGIVFYRSQTLSKCVSIPPNQLGQHGTFFFLLHAAVPLQHIWAVSHSVVSQTSVQCPIFVLHRSMHSPYPKWISHVPNACQNPWIFFIGAQHSPDLTDTGIRHYFTETALP